MGTAQNRFEQARPRRPHCCETQQPFVPAAPGLSIQ